MEENTAKIKKYDVTNLLSHILLSNRNKKTRCSNSLNFIEITEKI